MAYQASSPPDLVAYAENEELQRTNTKRYWQFFSLIGFVAMVGSVAVVGTELFSSKNSQVTSLIETAETSTPNSNDLNLVVRTGEMAIISYSALPEDDKKALFENFKIKYSKKYSTAQEEANRYKYFLNNLEVIDGRNDNEMAVNGRATHGVTKFTDYSTDEFNKLLGAIKDNSKDSKSEKSYKLKETDLTYVSWIGVYTTPVKNQGYCGSCWAFSATEQIESDSIRAGISTKFDYFSEQQIVDCDEADWGCDGGSTETAYIYIKNAGGIESASDYPYVSKDGVSTSCTSNSSDYAVTVDHFTHVYGEDSMVNYVLTTGPLSVCLDASSWGSYENGILHDCGDEVDHCVQVVGVNTEENYWIVRNSWGTDWGVDGYIFLNLYNNTCDITYDPSYVTVSSV